jgi:hypothetical protein
MKRVRDSKVFTISGRSFGVVAIEGFGFDRST